jgi:hypothetical protein
MTHRHRLMESIPAMGIGPDKGSLQKALKGFTGKFHG